VYYLEPGALNEHLADVFGLLIKQRYLNHTISQATWLVGEDIVTDKFPGKALRTFKNETAYRGDLQPKNRKNQQFGPNEWSDNGGVHIWSGIPNRAFREFCVYLEKEGLEDKAWGIPGKVWYEVMTQKVGQFTGFKGFKKLTIDSAKTYGGKVENLLTRAWSDVGL
jgi:Zn-dependent metalloprotease